MGICCSCKDSTDEPITSIKPYEKRSCTDVFFLLLFLGAWAGTASIASKAIAQDGDPNRIIRGYNMEGKICGKDAGVENKPLAAWPYPPEYNYRICVASCDETQTDSRMAVSSASTKFLFFCVPTVTVNGSVTISVSGDFQSKAETFSRAVGDMWTASWVIGFSSAFAIVLAFGYLIFVRKFASCVVWGILIMLAMGGAFVGWSFLKAADEAEAVGGSDRSKLLRGFGYFTSIATFLFCIVVISMRKRIRIAIEVVKEASRAMSKMKSMVFFPIFPFLVGCLYFAFWIILALYVYSVANRTTVKTPSTVTQTFFTSQPTGNPANSIVYERDTSFNNSLWYHFFTLLWNVQFLIYLCYMVICGAVADYYFSARPGGGVTPTAKRQRPRGQRGARGGGSAATAPQPQQAWNNGSADGGPTELSATPVMDSVKRVFRFHLGTIAFGSLIIAIINFIRAVVKYVQETSAKHGGRVQKCLLCMIQCCLWCLKCCADKISRNAFIWCSIYGDAFIPSASGSFQIIWNNLARVAAINVVGAYLMLLGKILVALAAAGVGGIVLTNNSKYEEELSSPVIPCLCIFVLSYLVASLFMIVYETTIDTIFLCFLVDSEVNKNGQMLASPKLQELVGRYQAESQEMAKIAKDNAIQPE